MMKTVWFERPMLEGYKQQVEGFRLLGAEGQTPQNVLGDISQANAIVAGLISFDAALMDSCPDLKIIARSGIGYNNVDVAAASKRSILVTNVPDGPSVPTAEQTFMLILAVAKNVKQSEMRLRNAEGNYYARHNSMELKGKTLGLVGFGRIAKLVAKMARAFGMQVLTLDPFVSAELAHEHGVRLMNDLTELLASADIVSIHPPLNDDTYKFMNKERFAQMKAGSIFINAGRGPLVDEAALIESLETGHLFGAGLDVTDPEPAFPDNPLLAMDNVVLTPHVSSATPEGKVRLFEGALFQAIQVLKGEKPAHLVNPEAWSDARFKTD